MAAKKKAKKKVQVAMLSPEELIAGLRRNRQRIPTKASEAAHKKRKKRLKGTRFE